MTGINHIMAGATIAVVSGSALIGLPLALASHFVLDSLPHFAEDWMNRTWVSKVVWVVDAALIFTFVMYVLATTQDPKLALLGAFVSLSPDFVWIYRLFFVDGKEDRPLGRFSRFHSSIQKLESPNILYIEVLMAIVLFLTFVGVSSN